MDAQKAFAVSIDGASAMAGELRDLLLLLRKILGIL